MKYRGRSDRTLPEFDALTREEYERFRAAARVTVPVGYEALAKRCLGEPVARGAKSPHVLGVACKGHPVVDEPPTKKRGVRA